MFILFSISGGLDIWPVNNTSINENFELKFFENFAFLGELSNNWANGILIITAYKTFESGWVSLLTILEKTSTPSIVFQ